MKNIIVLSDSHGKLPYDEAFFEVLDNVDYIIHLGDGKNEANTLKQMYPNKVFCISGNCDSMSAPNFEIIQIENVKILITHGHYFKVKRDTTFLEMECRMQGVRFGLYGHTHIPQIDELDGLTLINPGSINYTGSYSFFTIVGDKGFAKIVYR